jgi:hypothetical protein
MSGLNNLTKNNMKIFKLIKKYPGSPELGTIVNENSNHSLYQTCIDEPEFWEEINKYPVGTKVMDTYSEPNCYIYEKISNCYWKIGTQDYFNIDENTIGGDKRFKVI